MNKNFEDGLKFMVGNNLTKQQALILITLHTENKPMSSTDIAQKINTTTVSLYNQLKLLAAKGLIINQGRHPLVKTLKMWELSEELIISEKR